MAEEAKPPIEPEKEVTTPSEGVENRSDDPEDIAKAMLMEGYDREKIYDEIVEVTGLTKRKIWTIRSSLAKKELIPTRAQLKKMEREKPGPAEEAFHEEGEGVPFRRARPAHVLIESILNQFGVKDRARSLIVSRAERAGGMHPSELERALMDLDTGLKRREVSYITEEYYLAIQQEEDMSRDRESRSYPMRRGEPERGGSYSTRYGERDQPTGADYDRDSERRPWDKSQRYPDERMLDERRLTDILQRERRNWEEQARKERDQETIGQLREDMGVIVTELRNLKENPPVQPGPTGPSEYEKSLEHTIDRQDKRQEELMTLIKEERSEAKVDLKEVRDTYGSRVDKLQDDLKASERQAASRISTGDYKADEMRLVADMGNRFTEVLRDRGSPARIFVEAVAPILSETGPPPRRDRGQPASVADLVGPDYVER